MCHLRIQFCFPALPFSSLKDPSHLMICSRKSTTTVSMLLVLFSTSAFLILGITMMEISR